MISISDRLRLHCHEVASLMLMDGASPYEIDKAMEAFGFTMGIYEAEDWVGLDVGYELRKVQKPSRDPAGGYIPIADRMVEEGRLGKKLNVGWYRYPGGNGKVEDPIVDDLVIEESWFAKVERRDFSESEILEHLLCALVSEVCEIMEEGICTPTDMSTILEQYLHLPKEKQILLAAVKSGKSLKEYFDV